MDDYEAVADEVSAAEAPESLQQAFAGDQRRYADKGWHLVVTNEEAGLYRPFLNDSLRKSPDVFVARRRGSPAAGEGAGRQARPWYVRSNIEGVASSFASLAQARERFDAYAREAQELVFGVHAATKTVARKVSASEGDGRDATQQKRQQSAGKKPLQALMLPRAVLIGLLVVASLVLLTLVWH